MSAEVYTEGREKDTGTDRAERDGLMEVGSAFLEATNVLQVVIMAPREGKHDQMVGTIIPHFDDTPNHYMNTSALQGRDRHAMVHARAKHTSRQRKTCH
jgi:hypothetical protein